MTIDSCENDVNNPPDFAGLLPESWAIFGLKSVKTVATDCFHALDLPQPPNSRKSLFGLAPHLGDVACAKKGWGLLMAKLEIFALWVDQVFDVVPASKLSLYNLFGKRALDLAIIILALPVLLLLLPVITFAICCTGAAPIYRHKRVGQNGKLFNCLKFQTMLPNADALMEQHLNSNPEAAREWETRQKLANDPRITSLGKFLRATSLDELPQLWNVIRGEMSLVGPRPATVDQMKFYRPKIGNYTKLRPGITGSWQVSPWRGGDFEYRVLLDTSYQRHVSFRYDLGILFATFAAVYRKTGE